MQDRGRPVTVEVDIVIDRKSMDRFHDQFVNCYERAIEEQPDDQQYRYFLQRRHTCYAFQYALPKVHLTPCLRDQSVPVAGEQDRLADVLDSLFHSVTLGVTTGQDRAEYVISSVLLFLEYHRVTVCHMPSQSAFILP